MSTGQGDMGTLETESRVSVAVVGAGNVGSALAADLSLRGFDVRLFNRSEGRLRDIREAGGITASGAVAGFAPISVTTTSLHDAVDGVDVIAVTLPTATLPDYAGTLLNSTTDGQLIWLNPGHTGGALYLAAEAARSGAGARRICQLTTASHISRLAGPAAVQVFLLTRAAVATLPACHLDACHTRLETLLPGQFLKAETILEVDLANLNALMHPPGMVCNAGWIEASEGRFGFYSDGTRETVSAVIDALDHERLAIAERLGVHALPFAELFDQLGFTPNRVQPGATAADAIASSELIHPIQSPPTLDHRYLHEDVAWGLVPWMHLARAVDVETPTIDALTHLAGVMNGINYEIEGLTLERMGLAGLSPPEIRAAVLTPRS